MKYKLLSIFLCMQIIFLPVISYAEITETTEGKATPIEKNTPAPYTGVLLDPTAVAKILSDKEYQKKKCELDQQYSLDKAKAKCDLDANTCKIERDICQKKYDEINKLKDEEIKRLQNLVVKDNSDSMKVLIFVGGVLLGMAATIGIGFAVAQIK